MLQQLVASLQQQLADSNRKVDVLLQEVAELKELLVRKTQEEQKQRNIAKGLSKIIQNKSERQTPAKQESASGDGCTQDAPEAKPTPRSSAPTTTARSLQASPSCAISTPCPWSVLSASSQRTASS